MSNPVYLPPPEHPLQYLHIDPHFVVVSKPSGLLSVPGRGAEKQDCLWRRVVHDFPDALIVHRLDMETSGLMVLARDADTHRRLSGLFQDRLVEKRYVAMIDGLPTSDSGQIDLPLLTDWPNRPRQKIDFDAGKPSLTRFEVIARYGDRGVSRIALMPETGRSHQLRVHMLALGHPILGDALYAPPSAQAQAERLLLHAEFLAFGHPHSGERVACECPAPF
ncbi:pseudouridine synthase A [Azoarcus olearius]|uniref:pseudouridine synthase n=1 Tax=Azoarcus sp. (strain BH72) TaxID=418699 RepID=UPI000806314A|nr:pseudouridine synthase [Azoarcus olearius]ANQ85061.1 pseudouridine synthase A [Azoarcus olearius]